MLIQNDLNFKYSVDNYEAAKQVFMDICHSLDIPSNKVGFFGKVGFPGISDIDVLVISSPEKLKKLNQLFKRQQAESSDFKYLFWHSPVYLIESVVEVAHRLHTLQELSFYGSGSPFDAIKSKLTKQEFDILNIIWFISLIHIMSDLYRKIQNNNPISLRLILLLYSNLMHSALEFSEENSVLPINVLSSNDLRAAIRKNDSLLTNDLIWNQCNNLFVYTARKFDIYCKKNVAIGDLIPTSSLIISKNIIMGVGEKSSIDTDRFISKLKLNPEAFRLVWDYYKGRTSMANYTKYLQASLACKIEYNYHGIPYQFIEPIRDISSPFKRKILRLLNRTQLPKLI